MTTNRSIRSSRGVNLPTRLHKVFSDLTSLQTSPDSQQSPGGEVWSAAEYIAHCLDMIGETIAVVRDGRAEPRAPIVDLADGEEQLQRVMAAEDAGTWDREIPLGGPLPASPRWMLHHLRHDLEHHRLDVLRGYARLQLAKSKGSTVRR